MPLPRVWAAQHGSPVGPLCLPIATLFSSSLFSHISQDLNLDLSFPCQLPSVGATEPAAPSLGDMSEVIYQMHHLYLDMQNLHMSSCRQLPSGSMQNWDLLMVQTLEDESGGLRVLHASESMKLRGLVGPWKRTALCTSSVLMRDLLS